MSFLFVNVNHEVGAESSESIPISLGYVLAALKADGFYGAILDDLQDRPLSLGNLQKWIERVDASVVGFTVYQSTIERIRFLCRYIKERRPETLIVFGGPQSSPMPADALEDLEDVDILARGDGEVVMPAIARALAEGKPLTSAPGLALRTDDGIIDTGAPPPPPDDLDAYASPYLSGILNLQRKDTAILLSSRGCKHVCRFCITPSICRGKIRYHSVERTLAEMEYLVARGIERFWFADPNFTENRERTERLLEEKLERGITTPFWCQTRSDLVDPPLIEKLSRAGADTLAFGLESGSPGVLRATNKKITLGQARDNIKAAQAQGMQTELFTIFGLPGETVEDARQTLEFVRESGVSIESNSGSQQMQLYFGSTYVKNPEKFGFKPFPFYRPKYLSIGADYETEKMSSERIKKVRNMWVLANEQMERDVYLKQRTFEVIDYLLDNRADLADEPAFYAYGALTAASIEEFDLAAEFLDGYGRLTSAEGNGVGELISGLSFFKETDGAAGPMDRLIFDSRSWMDGVSFTGISGKYWDVLLGRGLLLESFEEAFVGAKAEDEISFDFTFPDDYGQEELQGRKVDVKAKLRKVFRAVDAKTIADVRNLNIKNTYLFPDLDLLREQNEILYHFAVRDSDPKELLRTPTHFLTLVHNLGKLGKRERIRELSKLLEGNPAAMNAFTDTLTGAGKCEWAVEHILESGDHSVSSSLKRVRCLHATGRSQEALNLLRTLPEGNDDEYRETLLECLKKAEPDSDRIRTLDREILDHRVHTAFKRERPSVLGLMSSRPIVHGWDGR